MEHEMRRKERQLDAAACEKIWDENEYGVLSTVGPDGAPYGVPLSYCRVGGRIYFHCAGEGHKLENLAAHPQATFCVVGRTELLPAQFSTKYESVIAFGPVHEVTGSEKTDALRALVAKLAPEFIEKGESYIQAAQGKARVYCLVVERMTGKGRA